jgi:predicted metal-dependent enzyme (double-stranded beta helix superfamily)
MSIQPHLNAGRFGTFVGQVERALDIHGACESGLLGAAGNAMRELVSHDDWLADAHAEPHPQYYQYYQQYLLHLDARERFSVVSFVWGPGQATPIHDHLVWGVIGVLRGAEVIENFEIGKDGRLARRGESERMGETDVACVSPAIGDVHRVRNAFDDRVSVSIHVYGGNIGAIARHVYPEDGGRKNFMSGYANTHGKG